MKFFKYNSHASRAYVVQVKGKVRIPRGEILSSPLKRAVPSFLIAEGDYYNFTAPVFYGVARRALYIGPGDLLLIIVSRVNPLVPLPRASENRASERPRHE